MATHFTGEHGAELVLPVLHRLVTDVDAALGQHILTFRNDSEKRTYIMATRRMISGDELKYRNGDIGLRGRGILPAIAVRLMPGAFRLTEPSRLVTLVARRQMIKGFHRLKW